jgi:hypothetical protein
MSFNSALLAFCLVTVTSWILLVVLPSKPQPSNTEAALSTWARDCKPETLRWGAMVNAETHERAFVAVCPPGGDK